MIFVDVYDYHTGKFLASFDIEDDMDWVDVCNFDDEYGDATTHIVKYQEED